MDGMRLCGKYGAGTAVGVGKVLEPHNSTSRNDVLDPISSADLSEPHRACCGRRVSKTEVQGPSDLCKLKLIN